MMPCAEINLLAFFYTVHIAYLWSYAHNMLLAIQWLWSKWVQQHSQHGWTHLEWQRCQCPVHFWEDEPLSPYFCTLKTIWIISVQLFNCSTHTKLKNHSDHSRYRMLDLSMLEWIIFFVDLDIALGFFHRFQLESFAFIVDTIFSVLTVVVDERVVYIRLFAHCACKYVGCAVHWLPNAYALDPCGFALFRSSVLLAKVDWIVTHRSICFAILFAHYFCGCYFELMWPHFYSITMLINTIIFTQFNKPTIHLP